MLRLLALALLALTLAAPAASAAPLAPTTPYVQVHPPQSAGSPQPAQRPGKGETILIIAVPVLLLGVPALFVIAAHLARR